MNKKTKTVALAGIMSALMIVLFTLETVIGAMWITPPAVLSLSVLFVFCFSYDWKFGLLSGVIFGVSSLVIAFIVGNPLFIIPTISVLPRVITGIAAYGIFYLAKRLCGKGKSNFVKENLPYSIGAFFGIILNTLSVLIALTLFAPAEYGNTFAGWLKAVITLNFPIELACAVILTPILSKAVLKYKRACGLIGE